MMLSPCSFFTTTLSAIALLLSFDAQAQADSLEYVNKRYKGNVEQVIHEEGGVIRTMQFNRAGQLLSITAGNTDTTLFQYSNGKLHRQLVKEYDILTTIAYGYDAQGNLTHEYTIVNNDTINTKRITYNNLNKPLVQNAGTVKTIYTYDDRGNVIRAVHDTYHATNYRYDEHNNRTEVTSMYNDFVEERQLYKYDSQNRMIEEQTSARTANVYQTTTYTYNKQGQLTEQRITDASGKYIVAIVYDYDSNGNKISEATMNSQQQITLSHMYEYDHKGNLTKHTVHTPAMYGNPASTEYSTYIYRYYPD